MEKIGVILFIVGILLVSSVYSMELPWPKKVPFGESFHEILYVDVIASADNDGEIEVNGTLIISSGAFIRGNGSGLYDLNLTGVIIENVIIEGNANFTGNVSIDGSLHVSDYIYGGSIFSDYLTVNDDIFASNIFTDSINAESYCDKTSTTCTTIEDLLNLSNIGLINVLDNDPDASGFGGVVNIGGALNLWSPFTVWNNTDYIELNYGGGYYALQSNQNIRISGPGAEDLTELKLGAITTSVSGDLNVGGSIGIGTDDPGKQLTITECLRFDNAGTGNVYVDFCNDDASYNDDGVALRIQTNPASGEPIFRVLSSGGSERLRVEHDGYLRTSNELYVSGNGESYIGGDLNVAGQITNGEVDPIFIAWDKSDGISITESQISDLYHFTTDDEIDPQVGNLTSDRWCKVNLAGDEIVCEEYPPVLEEVDPKVGTLNSGKWCTAADDTIICTSEPPLDSMNWGNISDIPDGFLDGVDNDTNTDYCSDGTCEGDLEVNGDLTVSGGQIYLPNSNTYLEEGSGNSIRLRTNNGYIDIGAQNDGWIHMYSDGKPIIFNKAVWVIDDTFSSYDADLKLQREGTTKLTLGSTSSTFTGNLTVGGDVTATQFLYSSDERLKKEIKGIDHALDKILHLEGVSFKWKGNSKESIGLIAQEVEKVFPELVSISKETGLRTLAYGNLVAPLIEATKSQQKQIEQLKEQVRELKKYVKGLDG